MVLLGNCKRNSWMIINIWWLFYRQERIVLLLTVGRLWELAEDELLWGDLASLSNPSLEKAYSILSALLLFPAHPPNSCWSPTSFLKHYRMILHELLLELQHSMVLWSLLRGGFQLCKVYSWLKHTILTEYPFIQQIKFCPILVSVFLLSSPMAGLMGGEVSSAIAGWTKSNLNCNHLHEVGNQVRQRVI